MVEIIGKIMELSWYEVFIIAVVDDAILFVKLWWLWVLIVAIALLGGIITVKRGE